MKLRHAWGVGILLSMLLILPGCGRLGQRAPAAAILPTRVPPTAGPSPTPLHSPTPTPTLTPTVTLTLTPSPTVTVSPTVTASPTMTDTVTPSLTPTPESTHTLTPIPGPVRLEYGGTFSGTLGAHQSALEFTFEGQADDVIRVEVEAGWEPDVVLVDPAGTTLGEAPLPVLRLPEDGAYRVLIQGEGGAFALTPLLLSRGGGPAPADLPLAYGDTIYGLITPNRFGARYTFEGRRDDVIGLEMLGLTDDLDPYLLLMNPAGELIALNDDRLDGAGARVSDARIGPFALPEDGLYTVTAMRFLGQNGFTSGAYALRLTLEGQDPALASIQNRVLRYGDTITGVISDETPVYQFSFEGEANDSVTLALSRLDGDLDAFLALADFYGYELASIDDAQGMALPTDARIENLRLPVTGIYIIVATRYQRGLGTTEGAFRLTLERGDAESEQAADAPLPIAYGDTVTGTISDATPRVDYAFTGRAGDVVVIDLRRDDPSDTLDAYLLLENASGQRLAFNDDALDAQGQPSTDARIAGFRLPVDGDYVIIATRFLEEAGDTQGAYTLSLTLADP